MTPRDRSTRLSLLILVLFLGLPAMLTATAALQQRPDGEDRDLNPRPSVRNAPFDTSTWREWELWWRDRIPLRNDLLDLQFRLDDAFDDRTPPVAARVGPVLIGLDGWLFVDRSAEPTCYGPERHAAWADEIARARAVVTATGRTFRFAVAPDRETVVPQFLGTINTSCQEANRQDLLSTVLSEADVVDLATVITDERHVLRTDTHWSPIGALRAAEAILESIDPGTWGVPVVEEQQASRLGDLGRQIGADPEEVVNVEILEPPTGSVEQVETSVPAFRTITATNPDRRGSVFMFHDSFGGSGIVEGAPSAESWGRGAARYLRPWFGEFTNQRVEVTNASIITRGVAAQRLRASGVIVGLFVQRELERRLDPGLLVTPLAAALHDDLPLRTVDPTIEANGVATYAVGRNQILIAFSDARAAVELGAMTGTVTRVVDGDGVTAAYFAEPAVVSVRAGEVGRVAVLDLASLE